MLMIDIVVPTLLVLTGICAYAAINHLSIGLKRPFDRAPLLFAGMCVMAVLHGLTHILMHRAQNAADMFTALKLNLSAVAALHFLLLWFIAEFTQVRPQRLLWGVSLVIVTLFALNLVLPHGLQYAAAPTIEYIRLPWGETLVSPAGVNGGWFRFSVLTVAVLYVYGLTAFAMAWRRDRKAVTLAMFCGMAVLVATAVEGILVRAGVIKFIHLGPAGFLILVVVMSVALSHETRQRLQRSERRFRLLVEQSPFSIQVLAPDGQTRQVNAAWKKLWGKPAVALGQDNILQDRELVARGITPYLERGFAGLASEIPPIVYSPANSPDVHGQPRERWIRGFIYPIKETTGVVRDVILMHEDVTEKKRAEDAIRLMAAGVSAEGGEQFFQQLAQSLADIFNADMALVGTLDEHDPQTITTLALWAHGNIAPNISYALAGTPCAEVVGQTTCIYPRDVQRLFPNDHLLATYQVEGYIGAPLFDAAGKPLGLLTVLHSQPLEHIEQGREILDIYAARTGAELARRRVEAQIRRMAYEDYLTGLASRALLHERLTEVLARAHRTRECGALLLIDLDHFKTINDALSHDVGDEVLRAVGRRLSEVASPQVFVARLGGDEFVALLTTGDVEMERARQTALELAQQIMERLSSLIYVGERSFSVGASIGIVPFPIDNETEQDLLRHADMALYRAKSLGRANVQFYLPSLQYAADTRLQLEDGLRRVIAGHELELQFQPLVDASGRALGAEALLRWHHPELGDIQPATFIPVAEETGMIHDLGQWVLSRACERLKAWQQATVSLGGRLSINVCAWQFARVDFVEQVRETLAAQQVDPDRLTLELTETALLYDLDEAVEKLKALRALGLHIALDDFGTGYSSLAYLRDLPLDHVKIDKSFIAELDKSVDNPLVETMIAIGRHMRLGVVAEGVETEKQRTVLIQLGCERFQGYLYTPPLPEREFLQWLASQHTSNPLARAWSLRDA
jgi:diguanylate cyclase (GGDEF)-like protein/PAS domain S-box-containing protein